MDFIHFFSDVLFLFQNLIQDSVLHLIHTSPVCDPFSTFPSSSSKLDSLEEKLVRHFAECQIFFFDGFLLTRLGQWVFREGTTKVLCPSHHGLSKGTHDMGIGLFTVITLLRPCFQLSSLETCYFPLSIRRSLETSGQVQPTVRGS